MTTGDGPPGADLPRIAIERTPANDVYLVLTGLGLGPEAEQALADPVGFLAANRVEARTVAQLLQARFEEVTRALTDAPSPAPAVPALEPVRPATRQPARDEAGRLLRSSPSLLR